MSVVVSTAVLSVVLAVVSTTVVLVVLVVVSALWQW